MASENPLESVTDPTCRGAVQPRRRKTLALLVAAAPEQPNFSHALNLARAAREKGIDVYWYCLDEAVAGVNDPRLQSLGSAAGVKLFACAYGARRHRIPLSDGAVFAGLTVVHEWIRKTDRFVCFS
jgi:sulfur relay (sulfurtransferase) complex TusBCD TusD component (DsrE family)